MKKKYLSLYLFLIFIVTLVSFYEYKKSKEDLFELLKESNNALIETIISNTENSIISYNEIEDELTRRVENNINLITILYNNNLINDNVLSEIAKENNLYRINIFSDIALLTYSNLDKYDYNIELIEIHKKILEEGSSKKILGFRESKHFLNQNKSSSKMFSVISRIGLRGIISISINTDYIENLKNRIDLNRLLLNQLVNKSRILYLLIENDNEILYASESAKGVEKKLSNDFLKKT